MEIFEGLQNVAVKVSEDIKVFITEKPLATAGIGAGIVGGTGLLVTGIKRKKRKTSVKKRATKKRTKRGRSRDRKFISKQKHEKAYIKRKKKLGKKITRPRYKTKKRVGKIYYTKNGQPYKILRSGKARFIKGRRKK